MMRSVAISIMMFTVLGTAFASVYMLANSVVKELKLIVETSNIEVDACRRYSDDLKECPYKSGVSK